MKETKKIIAHTVIGIPAYCPDAALVPYVQQLIAAGYEQIVIVDDGSGKAHAPVFEALAALPQCHIIMHQENQGKGAGLKDVFDYYLAHHWQEQYDGVITVDADGQHDVADVVKVSMMLEQAADEKQLVLGERTFSGSVPFRSKLGNFCTRKLYQLLYGLKLRDTQTGLRGLTNSLLEEARRLSGERYEYEMNMLIYCAVHKVAVKEVPIRTIYLEGNPSSHFHVMRDSIKIYGVLLGTFIKYTWSSLSAALIDLLVFQLLALAFGPLGIPGRIFGATLLARLASAFYNYRFNQKIVFKSNEKTAVSLSRYGGLCAVQLILSALGVQMVSAVFDGRLVCIKAVIDTLLFFLSYWVQKNFIFYENIEEKAGL